MSDDYRRLLVAWEGLRDHFLRLESQLWEFVAEGHGLTDGSSGRVSTPSALTEWRRRETAISYEIRDEHYYRLELLLNATQRAAARSVLPKRILEVRREVSASLGCISEAQSRLYARGSQRK